MAYSRAIHASGGGWGGSEDPRAVMIDDHLYLTYTTFNGWSSMRVTLSRLDRDMLPKKTWTWSEPVHISPEGQVHKNWVIFPEKIAGKYAILHSISPKIEVEYRDSLMGIGTTEPLVESAVGARRAGRDGFWDNWVRGAGPPPIKTEYGWLLFYHAMDARDPDRYKIGAMILDLNDPTQVLYRSSTPILAPDMPYENDWKQGVIYACGAIVKDNTLFVYYGGGDKTVNVATAPLRTFMDELISGRHSVLTSAV